MIKHEPMIYFSDGMPDFIPTHYQRIEMYPLEYNDSLEWNKRIDAVYDGQNVGNDDRFLIRLWTEEHIAKYFIMKVLFYMED